MPDDAAPHAPSASPEDADPASSYPTLDEMAVLLPQYEIHRVIGIGGMGAIYLGRQSALDRWVAIKLLPISAARNAEDAQRFIKEARAMAKLVHPHIVAVFDFGQTHEGHLYLVMEYVEGSDLHRRTRAGEITPKRARQVIFQLCDALQFAHDRGVVHRDIKPANILITDQWQVKVADFGLARDTAAIPNADEPEYGTPDYTAPERLVVGAVVDHRADIYSLGVVMHEMLTGKTPSSAGKDAGKGLPPEFAAVISKCLMAEPDDRYQKASEVKLALAGALAEIKKAPDSAGGKTSSHALGDDELSPEAYQPAALHRLVRTLGPLGWGLASVMLLIAMGWLVVRNHAENQGHGASGGGGNTTAGAGNLSVFAPPSPPSAATPAADTKPEEMGPPAPVPAPQSPAPAAAKAVATAPTDHVQPAVLSPPTAPLDKPYQVEDGPAGEIARLKGHTASTFYLKLLRDQRRVVSASYDGTVRIWDLLDQKELLRVDAGIQALLRLDVSPDEKRIAVSSFATSRVAVIEIESGKVIATTALPGAKLGPAVFAGDNRTVLIGTYSDAPNLYQWHPDKGEALEPLPKIEALVYDMRALPGDPPGRVFIEGSTPNGESRERKPISMTYNLTTGEITPGSGPWLGSGRLNFSADGARISMLNGGSISVVSQSELKLEHAIQVPPSKPRPGAAMLVTDGRLIATLWSDNTFKLLEVETGEAVYSAPLPQHPTDVAVSQDGRWAVLSTSRSNRDSPAGGDFDLIVWRLPKLDTLASDLTLNKLARQQLSDLSKNDPELAKLQETLAQAVKWPTAEDKAKQLQTLNSQYIGALRRKMFSQSPTEQLALKAEMDLIIKGSPLPQSGMDASLNPVLKDLRGIYRGQLKALDSQQKQAEEAASQATEALFAPLRQAREQTGDRLGLMRLKILYESVAAGGTADATAANSSMPPSPAAPASQSVTAPAAAGTPVRRPDRLCNVISIVRASKNGVVPTVLPVGRIPQDLGPAVAIAGGEDRAYALLADGRVKGWGSWNSYPVTIPDEATNIVKISASSDATLALRTDGKIISWGAAASSTTPAPAQVFDPPSGKAPADICAGGDGGGYVVFTDGSIQSTSPDAGTTPETTPPVDLGPVAQLIYAPHAGYCALLRDGSVVYWGQSVSPIAPPSPKLRDLVSLTFSEKYAAALQRDGILVGWGELAAGQHFRIARVNSSIGFCHDPAGRIFPIHHTDHSWELIPNPSVPDYLSEDRLSALEGRLRGCLDVLFTQYYVICLRPQ